MKFTRRGWGVAVFIGSAFLAVAAEPPAPKLLGIVRVENRKSALLELKEQTPWGTMVTRKPILSEGECDAAFTVTAIDEKEATVSMTHGRETLTVSLGQGPEEALANRALHFKAASFDQALD